jgi:hypothetical protein
MELIIVLLTKTLKKGKDKVLFYFNPVIIDRDSKYWGYPWDISDLLIKMDNGLFKIKCSLDHEISRDGEITRPDWQKDFPVICFSGHSTQPDIKVGQINGFDWLTISEIMDKVILTNKN